MACSTQQSFSPYACPANWLYCSGECRKRDFQPPVWDISDIFNVSVVIPCNDQSAEIATLSVVEIDDCLRAVGLVAENGPLADGWTRLSPKERRLFAAQTRKADKEVEKEKREQKLKELRANWPIPPNMHATQTPEGLILSAPRKPGGGAKRRARALEQKRTAMLAMCEELEELADDDFWKQHEAPTTARKMNIQDLVFFQNNKFKRSGSEVSDWSVDTDDQIAILTAVTQNDDPKFEDELALAMALSESQARKDSEQQVSDQQQLNIALQASEMQHNQLELLKQLQVESERKKKEREDQVEDDEEEEEEEDLAPCYSQDLFPPLPLSRTTSVDPTVVVPTPDSPVPVTPCSVVSQPSGTAGACVWGNRGKAWGANTTPPIQPDNVTSDVQKPKSITHDGEEALQSSECEFEHAPYDKSMKLAPDGTNIAVYVDDDNPVHLHR